MRCCRAVTRLVADREAGPSGTSTTGALPCTTGDPEGHGVLGPGVADVDEQGAVGSVCRDAAEAMCFIQRGECGFTVLAESDEALSGLRPGWNDSEMLGPVEPRTLCPWVQCLILASFIHRNPFCVWSRSAGDLQDVVKATLVSFPEFDVLDWDRVVESLTVHSDQAVTRAPFGCVDIVGASCGLVSIFLQGLRGESVVLTRKDREARPDQRSTMLSSPGFVIHNGMVSWGAGVYLHCQSDCDPSFFLTVWIQLFGLVSRGVYV